jgi:hypothetical protein
VLCVLVYVKQTIDKIMRIEDEFFPLIAGELGSSLASAEQYQHRLDDFLPVAKVPSGDRWHLLACCMDICCRA